MEELKLNISLNKYFVLIFLVEPNQKSSSEVQLYSERVDTAATG